MKGQVSLDLLLTLVLAIGIVSSITFVGNQLKENYETINLQNNLKSEVAIYSNFISRSQVISDTDFVAKLKINKFNYKNSPVNYSLEVNDNYIQIKFLNITISEEISNESLRVEKIGDYLVIENE